MMLSSERDEWARKSLDILLGRLIRDDGVGGSNPLTPTNLQDKLLRFWEFMARRCVWSPGQSPNERREPGRKGI
jgi:hypothetical protein